MRAAVLALLLSLATQIGFSTRRQSPSWDEGDHIYSGYMNWTQGEYGLNPEHPPLAKLVATLPLLGLHLKVAPRQGRYFKSEAYYGGRELIFRNDAKYGGSYSADTLLLRVHMAVSAFALITGLLLFLAGQEMFGVGAGLAALALYAFDPTVIAMAPFVATDSAGTCGFFAAVYMLYRFARQMSWQRAIACGVVAGLALATKHSAVLLLPVFLLLAAGEIAGRWKAHSAWPGRDARRLATGLGAIAAVALATLWGVYGFHYAMYARDVTRPTLAVEMAPLGAGMRAAIAACARFHLLPESYLYGLVDVQTVGLETPGYIFGKVYEHGKWFYFPAILSLKWTVPTLLLLAVGLVAFAGGKLRRPREVFFLTAPPLLFLAVAMAGPLNIGVRHVLPLFPFAFALAGAGAAWLAQRWRAGAVVVAALLLWHGVESLRNYPNYVPYANVLWGGPAKTNLYFSDSAADWAQQLKETRRWTDEHHVTECWFAYFAAPFLLPSDYGIPCKPLPTLDSMGEEDIDVPPVIHGPVLVSFGDLNGFEFGTKVRNPYQSLFLRTPDDQIAHGVAVFYGDFSLPDAASLEYVHQAGELLKKDPAAALRAARTGVALSPRGFDANVALGDALAANHDKAGAAAAYALAEQRVGEMEPEAQALWWPVLRRKMAGL